MSELDAYGLADKQTLQTALEIAPGLFAALAIAQKSDEDSFPLKSMEDLESFFRSIAGERGALEIADVGISISDVRGFPADLLPIIDRYELIWKIAALVDESFDPSHPLDLAAL